MASKNKKKKSTPMTGSELTLYLLKILVSTFVCVFFIAMPLFYHDKYYDIGDFKYKMFMYMTLVFFFFVILFLIPYFILQIRDKKITIASAKQLVRSLQALDWFMIAYLITTVTSYLLSPYRTDEYPEFFLFSQDPTASGIVNLPWEGYSGWNMGLRSQLMFIILYFLVSRLFLTGWKKDFLYIMLGSSSIVFLFGILHRFLVDPLGLYENLGREYTNKFLSTLGQSTWYSSYMVIVLPIGMALFMFCEKNRPITKYLLTIFVFIGGATFVTQNSDSAYFAFFSTIIIMFAASFTNNNTFVNFWEMMVVMLGAMKLVGLFQIMFPNHIADLDSLSLFASRSPLTWGLFILLCATYYFIKEYTDKGKLEISKYIRIRNIIIIAIIALVPLAIIIGSQNTKGLLGSALANVEYLNFNDKWGNNRGYIWRNTIEIMKEPLWRSMCLFGPGPDCYASVAYAVDPRATELYNFWNHEIVVCCHNEWLNMLFDQGIFGFITYFGIFVCSFATFIKRFNNPIMIAGTASVMAYFLHNFFCYQQILCTPMIFIFIALCKLATVYVDKAESQDK